LDRFAESSQQMALGKQSEIDQLTASLEEQRSAGVALEQASNEKQVELDQLVVQQSAKLQEIEQTLAARQSELDQLARSSEQLTLEKESEIDQLTASELQEYQTLKRENDDLQYKIFFMDNNQRDYDKGSEQMLNEHKYLNTLANVHQVRFNLKETQDRYNKMASELQAKLVEKQQKCHEIEAQFKALKNSVSKNAQFVRTGKALQPSAIAKWEEHEALKD